MRHDQDADAAVSSLEAVLPEVSRLVDAGAFDRILWGRWLAAAHALWEFSKARHEQVMSLPYKDGELDAVLAENRLVWERLGWSPERLATVFDNVRNPGANVVPFPAAAGEDPA